MKAKQVFKSLLPPLVTETAKRFRGQTSRRPPDWELVPEGWGDEKTRKIKGWNVADVAEAYAAKWPQFIQSLESDAPFGVPVDSLTGEFDLAFHNTVMSFAHALATAARSADRLTMLDWGGGFGHYNLIARALFPNVGLDYSCKDLPAMTEHGKRLTPEAQFFSDDACFARNYDFVMASTSLQYSEEWSEVAGQLARATKGFLFVTGLPMVLHSPCFVFVQRAHAFGYNTEYLAWCFNRCRFLSVMTSFGLKLTREYQLGYRPAIHRAPEQCEYRGYLFRSVTSR